MPFHSDDIRISLSCGPGPDGHWHGWYVIQILAGALRPLGLHPEQPASRITTPSPPAWWHAEAERRAR